MTATLQDVEALAGVHPSTVSRVLRKQENLKILEINLNLGRVIFTN